MSDYLDNEHEPTDDGPEELVTRAFSRCSNWPKDRLGVLGLSQGLRKAADRFSVTMQAIVARCAETSQYCPTDADLINVGRDLKADIDRANQPDITAEWKRKYGEPKPFDWKQIDQEHAKQAKERERTMLAAIKAKYPQELSWASMIEAARELGYEDYAHAWERGMVGGKH